jgi:hypothetical protein
MSIPHKKPVKPALHVHEKLLTPSTQVALFMHGLDAQSSILTEQSWLPALLAKPMVQLHM